MNELYKNENYSNETFEDIKHIGENGIEYQEAIEIMSILQYTKWKILKK